MSLEDGEWIVHGVAADDPKCIHTVEELCSYIDEVGFLPLFRNEIPGFSVEERTVPDFWWSGDEKKDPWSWRTVIASRGEIAYGKFFNKKAGFLSGKWLPCFCNYRRDGYDFDALWEDGKASYRQKKIMDLFHEDTELPSFEIKLRAGFGKEGEKNFDGTITELQMRFYLCVHGFKRKVNKKGMKYGWPVAVYSMPEHLFGYEEIAAGYRETPEESLERILQQLERYVPTAERKQMLKVLGVQKR